MSKGATDEEIFSFLLKISHGLCDGPLPQGLGEVINRTFFTSKLYNLRMSSELGTTRHLTDEGRAWLENYERKRENG